MIDSLRQIPNHISQGFTQAVAKGKETKERLGQHVKNQVEHLRQSAFWQKDAKPLYERTFAPLCFTDYVLLTGSVATALLASFVAVQAFTVAAFPLAAGGGTALAMGAYSFSRYRVNRHFKELAWEHADQMRQSVSSLSIHNRQFDVISQKYTELMQPKFKHLEDDIKQLHQEMQTFKKLVLSPSNDASLLENGKKSFLAYLKGLEYKWAPYKEIRDADEQEIEVRIPSP